MGEKNADTMSPIALSTLKEERLRRKVGRGCEDQTELTRTRTHRPVRWILIKLSSVQF